MIRISVAAGLIFAASVGVGSAAFAEDFPATPLQHGAPRDLPGERLIPGAQLAVDTINAVTQPILQPILAPDGAAPAAASAPAAKPHRHHHAHKLHASRHRGVHTAHRASHLHAVALKKHAKQKAS